MTDSMFSIGAKAVEERKVLDEIKAAVKKKTDEGLYDSVQLDSLKNLDVGKLAADGALLDIYLDALREAVFVDINDFEIGERRRFMPGFFVRIKRAVWKLLKFYTYRLWSQQNEINGLLLATTEAIDRNYREKTQELEERLAKLEKGIR